jgi:hypothetical protein
MGVTTTAFYLPGVNPHLRMEMCTFRAILQPVVLIVVLMLDT